MFFKKIFGEIGLGGRAIFAFGEVGDIRYQTQTLRAVVPLRLGYQVSEAWDISTGLTIQNNFDFKGIITSRDNFLWRYNYTLRGRYFHVHRWCFFGELSYGVNNIPDAYFLNDPRAIVFLGVAKKLK
ncbi:MAG: hypothetical protein AAF573_16375 [Bacteroidota bacterium]